jgi:HAD superfamily hydrolase (TIGR01509 family)
MEEHLIGAVAFDLDGLMVNTETLYDIVAETILLRRDKSISPAVIAQMMGRQSHAALQVLIDAYELTDTVTDLEQETEEIFLGLLPDNVAPMPGLSPLLDAIESRNLPKAIATSSRLCLVDPILEQMGWIDRFAFKLTSEDVTRGKPHPEIYLTAAHRFGKKPAEMLVLEDSMVGCQAGVAAGACVVAVPSKLKDQHDFAGAQLVVESLADRRIYDLLDLA